MLRYPNETVMKKDYKSVPIEEPVWREMHREKLDTGIDVYKLIALAWRNYKGGSEEDRPAAIGRAVAEIYRSGDDLIRKQIEQIVRQLEERPHEKTPAKLPRRRASG